MSKATSEEVLRKQRLYHREWKEKNPGYFKEYQRKWREANPDYQRQRYEKSLQCSLQVYVVRNSLTGNVKIGKGNGIRRHEQLQSCTDVDLTLCRVWRDSDPFLTETRWKTLLEGLRVRGEWYQADAMHVVDLYMVGREKDRLV